MLTLLKMMKMPVTKIFRMKLATMKSRTRTKMRLKNQDCIDKQYQATQFARKLLSGSNPPIDMFIHLGILPRFVEFLAQGGDHSGLQWEAAWVLRIIADGSSEQTKAVVEAGAVPRLIQLLKSYMANVVGESVWALGNIAGDGPMLRDCVLNNNVVAPLLDLIKPDIRVQQLKNVTWTIQNLCRDINPRPPFNVVKQFLPTLAQLVCHQDLEVQANTCWALSSLAGGSNEEIQEVVDSGVIPHLIKCLDSGHLPVVYSSLISIGNIVTGNDIQTDEVLKYDALPVLAKLLKHPEPYIVQTAAWTISNITVGNRTHIQKVIDADCLQPLLNILIK